MKQWFIFVTIINFFSQLQLSNMILDLSVYYWSFTIHSYHAISRCFESLVLCSDSLNLVFQICEFISWAWKKQYSSYKKANWPLTVTSDNWSDQVNRLTVGLIKENKYILYKKTNYKKINNDIETHDISNIKTI